MGITAISSKLDEARWWETSPNGKLHGDRGALANATARGHRTGPGSQWCPPQPRGRLSESSTTRPEARNVWRSDGYRVQVTTSTCRPFTVKVPGVAGPSAINKQLATRWE